MVVGLGFVLMLVLGMFAAALALAVLFLMSMSRTIRRIRPQNRQLSPGGVWLCLIPIAGVVIALWMVSGMAASLRRQFEELDEDDPLDNYGSVAGRCWLYSLIASRLIWIAGFVFDPLGYASLVSDLLLTLSLIAWIDYWVLIAKYHRRLKKLLPLEPSADELDYGDDIHDQRRR